MSRSETPHQSLTLSELSPAQIPSTACRSCKHAVWHRTASELICFCRVMRVRSYTPTSTLLEICDGMDLDE